MKKLYLFDRTRQDIPERNIPNILTHRLGNIRRLENGEKPVNFWDTVPDLLDVAKGYAKKNNESLYVVKEKIELTLTIGAVKGIEYVY